MFITVPIANIAYLWYLHLIIKINIILHQNLAEEGDSRSEVG